MVVKDIGKSAEVKSTGKGKTKWIGLAAVIVIIAGVVGLSFLNYQNGDGTTGLAIIPAGPEAGENDTSDRTDSLDVTPTQYAVRQRYFEEVFRPRRDEYNLFGQAADFLKMPLQQVPDYFSLNNEGEIFADLPAIADDFSEIAYLVANGRYFSIGYLDEAYYKQPEFYPNFKVSGLRYWTEPDPRYWTPHGYGSYPAEQWTTIKEGEAQEFTAVVFFYTSWGVQTFQGVTLMPNSEGREYFDIDITPQTFLLEPAFPKFYRNWAYKVVIKGRPKEGIPKKTYNVGINVERPPIDMKEQWEFEHRNIYFDAAVSGIGVSGDQILLHVTVE